MFFGFKYNYNIFMDLNFESYDSEYFVRVDFGKF